MPLQRIRPLALVLLLAAAPALQAAEFASLNAAGTASGNAPSFNASLSANGRFVAFQSSATDLVPGGTSGVNIFVRDLLTGTTVLASVNDAPYTGIAEFPRISADGRYVAYERFTCAFFFCPTIDAFVRDLQAGTTTLVSVGLNGQPAGGARPIISADGRRVAFQSNSSNLVANDANGTTDVFVRDLDAGTTQLVSVGTSGTSGNGASRNPSLSADGRAVAFESDASDLVADDANGASDVFVRDLVAGTTRLASANLTGIGTGNGASLFALISANGSRVSFTSTASDLVAADTNNSQDVFVRDLPNGPTRLVSANTAGTDSASGISIRPYLTPTGRFVAFESDAGDLVANDQNGREDVFLRDVDAGVTRLVSVNAAGTGSAESDSEVLLPLDSLAGIQVASDDGRFVVFASSAQDLVTGVTYPCDFLPCNQVYRRDFQTNTTTLLSADPTGTTAGDNSDPSTGGQISADGRVAVFQIAAFNLAPQPDANEGNDIFFVGAPQGPALAEVPTLSQTGLAALALLLAGGGFHALRRRRAAGAGI